MIYIFIQMDRQRVVFLTVHGMGKTERNYADTLKLNLMNRLNSDGRNDWAYLNFNSIYYQEPLHAGQTKYFESIQDKVDWRKSREFFVHSFSDPVSLETRKEEDNSPYEVCQRAIMNTLDSCLSRLAEMNNTLPPVVILAQSLGGQVISNYIWDAQREVVAGRQPASGIWKNRGPLDVAKGGIRDKFRRLASLRCFITTGCNIPLFLAGDPYPKAINSLYLHSGFEWKNYYDADDVLGYPLADLGQSYEEIVEDIRIQCSPGVAQETPFTHGTYWETDSFLDDLAGKLREIINS
jgi:hypothetical protein